MKLEEKRVIEKKIENMMIVSMRHNCKNPSEGCRDVSTRLILPWRPV